MSQSGSSTDKYIQISCDAQVQGQFVHSLRKSREHKFPKPIIFLRGCVPACVYTMNIFSVWGFSKALAAIFHHCLLGLAPCSSAIAGATAQEATSGWKFSVMPYVWLPGIKSDVKYGPPSGGSASANVSADESDVLSNLRWLS
ncbi:MAG: hypothetical protein IPJ50_03910 [Betaproteobacteria bacterium]|nr:hypothetical protein [Betaproteobacteria bacterium]